MCGRTGGTIYGHDTRAAAPRIAGMSAQTYSNRTCSRSAASRWNAFAEAPAVAQFICLSDSRATGVTPMRWMPVTLIVVACCWNVGWAADVAHSAELPTNDYPTVVRADYVFGCMQVNGQ